MTDTAGIKRHDHKRGGHHYTIDGKRAIGVTTALNGIPKDALKYWAAREVAEHAVDNLDLIRQLTASGGRGPAVSYLKEVPFQKRDEAAVRGTDVHLLAEQYMRGDEVDVPRRLEPYVMGFARYIEDHNPTSVHSELLVASRAHLYAGTLDSIEDIPEYGRCLVDYKTSGGVYGEYVLQCAGYRYAEVMVDADGNEHPMPQVDRVFILHIKPGDYELIPAQADEAAFDRFLKAMDNYRWNVQSSKLDKLLGEPVRPTRKAPAA